MTTKLHLTHAQHDSLWASLDSTRKGTREVRVNREALFNALRDNSNMVHALKLDHVAPTRKGLDA